MKGTTVADGGLGVCGGGEGGGGGPVLRCMFDDCCQGDGSLDSSHISHPQRTTLHRLHGEETEKQTQVTRGLSVVSVRRETSNVVVRYHGSVHRWEAGRGTESLHVVAPATPTGQLRCLHGGGQDLTGGAGGARLTPPQERPTPAGEKSWVTSRDVEAARGFVRLPGQTVGTKQGTGKSGN